MIVTDMTGRRFGALMVTEFAGRFDRGGRPYWRCRCDCGEELDVVALALSRKPHCDRCKRRHKTNQVRERRHRSMREQLRSSWSAMMYRCYSGNAKSSFRWYGARGIAVCDRWHSFENFAVDMSPRPPGMSLDRIDANGDYSPDNCRWATQAQQVRTQRRTTIDAVDVQQIRWLLGDGGFSGTDVAKAFSIGRSAVAHIKSRRSWADVP